MRDVSRDLDDLRRRLNDARAYLRIDELAARRPQLETEAGRPDLWDDPEVGRKVTSELNAVAGDLDLFAQLENDVDDVATLVELAQEEGDDSVEAEIEEALTGLAKRFDELELRSLFTGAYDDH